MAPMVKAAKMAQARRVRVAFRIPYPPSMNKYYRHVGARTILSRDGRKYAALVRAALLEQFGADVPAFGSARLAISIRVEPPDRRRRDLDNMLKAALDGLQAAGIFDDDAQIDRLLVVRSAGGAPGRLWVAIRCVGVGTTEGEAGG